MRRSTYVDDFFRKLRYPWQRLLWEKTDEEGEVLDCYSVSDQPATSAEVYRLVWCHSKRKAEQDALVRNGRLQRAMKELADLRHKLQRAGYSS